MGRTKQTASKSTGGKTPKKQLANTKAKTSYAFVGEQLWDVVRVTDHNERGQYLVTWRMPDGSYQTGWDGPLLKNEPDMKGLCELAEQYGKYRRDKEQDGSTALSYGKWITKKRGRLARSIAAGVEGTCMFDALLDAVKRLGIEGQVTQQHVDQFFEESKTQLSKDLNCGARWSQLNAFLGKFCVQSRLSLKTLRKNCCKGSVMHVQGVLKTITVPGLFR